MIKAFCYLINLIGNFSISLGSKLRHDLFCASVTALLVIGTTRYCKSSILKAISFDQDAVLSLCSILIVLILISVIDRKIDTQEVHPSVPFWTAWFLCFGVMTITSFIHPVFNYYRLWGIMSLTVIPMIIISIMYSEDRLKIVISLARNTVFVSYVFYILTFIISPYITKEGFLAFMGICVNPNNNGMICTSFFTAALFLLLVDDKNLFLDLLSMCVSFVIATIACSRTAQLAMVLEIIAALFIYLRHRPEHRIPRSVRSIALACVAAVVLSLAIGQALLEIDEFTFNSYAYTETEEESAKADAEEAQQWIDSDDIRTLINDVSSRRLYIWKTYSMELSLFGKGNPEGPLIEDFNASKWAHNNALDIWYASGFFAFLGYVMWLIVAVIFALRCMFGNTAYRREYLFTILAFTGYLTQAMLEITIVPMTTGIVFLCYCTLGPVAFKDVSDTQ